MDVDLGAFSDIAFLLIIFFILTTSLIKPVGKVVDIPASSQKSEKNENKNLTVTVMPDKILYGEDEESQKEVPFVNFRDDILSRNLKSKTEPERMIIVNVGNDVEYDAFFRVVTAISKAGGIVAMVEEEEDAK